MGWNSTIVILNDELHRIAEDKEFGRKVSDKLGEHTVGRERSPRYNAFEVAAQHHMDATSIIAVGGNTSKVLAMTRGSYRSEEDVARLLKELAADYGYRLPKIPEKDRESWRKSYDGNGYSM